ncbi:hypothetical protein HKD37_04G010793 [Glycine soja]
MVSSIYTLMCVLHSTIALTCGALMIFYSKEIFVLGHGSETTSKLQGTTPHDLLLIDTSDSFSGLLLFTIGCLLLMEDPEIAKFRDQGLKFLPEMEFLFKGTIATDFAAYAPSKDSRQYEGFNTRTKETNDSIDDNTDMEVNEPEIDTTTQNTSSAKENG